MCAEDESIATAPIYTRFPAQSSSTGIFGHVDVSFRFAGPGSVAAYCRWHTRALDKR